MKTKIKKGGFSVPLGTIFEHTAFKADNLKVVIYPNRLSMGMAAAKGLLLAIKKILQRKKEINILFAAAPSQNEVLDALVARKDVPWKAINCFHMDEYVGLKENHPSSFRKFLLEKIFSKVRAKSVHLIRGEAKNPETECRRYAKLLEKHLLDVVQGGIGLVPHIAFNDPENADFNDPYLVKVVKLQEESRIQQVRDGCFARLKDVPKHAFTVTMPPIIRARYISLVVPASLKAKSVKLTIFNRVDSSTPASIMRKHKNSMMFLDPDSALLIRREINDVGDIS
ncbi:MAG: 6-phosphogluconolactonase [Candidatus Omnitrophica bacterium]|nr:6-phosphogluconolactonase [Candidatus Omnitrophota bacterium]